MILNIALAVSLVAGCVCMFGGIAELWGNRKLVHNDAGANGALIGVGVALVILAAVGYFS